MYTSRLEGSDGVDRVVAGGLAHRAAVLEAAKVGALSGVLGNLLDVLARVRHVKSGRALPRVVGAHVRDVHWDEDDLGVGRLGLRSENRKAGSAESETEAGGKIAQRETDHGLQGVERPDRHGCGRSENVCSLAHKAGGWCSKSRFGSALVDERSRCKE